MDHRRIYTRRIATLALVIASLTFIVFTVFAQTGTVLVTFNWAAPTAGTPAVQYIVEQSINDGAWTQVAVVATNSYDLEATVGDSHRIRVVALDASGAQGPWSLPSDPYAPQPQAPGQPGKPYIAP